MVIYDLHSYLIDVGFGGLLRLNRLIGGMSILEVDIDEITVVIGEDCFCLIALFVRSTLQLANETRSG